MARCCPCGCWILFAVVCTVLGVVAVGSAVGAEAEHPAQPLVTDLSRLPALGPQPDGSHKVILVETTEVIEDNLQPPFSLHTDVWGLRCEFEYEAAKKKLLLNTPDEKLFGPKLIVDGKVAPALRCVVLRNLRYKGGVGDLTPGARQLWGVDSLPYIITMGEERKKKLLYPGDRRELNDSSSIHVKGIGENEALWLSFEGKEWAVPPGKRLPLPSISYIWPVAALRSPYSSGRWGDLMAARLVLSIDVVYHGAVDVETATIRPRDKKVPDGSKK